MVIKTGKVTVPKSAPGVYPTVTITDETITEDGIIVLTTAELDSLTDTRGQMEFYPQVSAGAVVITGERKELKDDTDLYYFLDTDGTSTGS